MRHFLTAISIFLASTSAFAADATVPVRQIMDITVKNWSGEQEEWKYIFDEDMLTSVFSKHFADTYRQAAKKPAYDTENNEPGDPFGYDVVTSSQDGCPIQDLAIAPGTPKDDRVSDVKVSFKLWSCMDEAEMKAMVNEVHFDVIEENGKPVIDDIHRVGDDGTDSLLVEMDGIIKGEE
ncbi:hypothetical protein [Agrobacterium sp.]|uniref:hypothetical protein n=1 Tax=Agrobacterium sp. TaxID=361 RepID=UPI0028AF1D83|nr:hypothetical protein [Agrobacterium sp.]